MATSASARVVRVAADAASIARLQSAVETRMMLLHNPSRLADQLELVERLSNGRTELNELRRCAHQLDKSTYTDLVDERWMEGWCPYPACGKRAAVPYEPVPSGSSLSAPVATGISGANARKVRLGADGALYGARSRNSAGGDASLEEQRGGIYDRAAAAYCSKECRARSNWFAARCVGRDNQHPEMLEDIEQRRRDVARSTRDLLDAQIDVDMNGEPIRETDRPHPSPPSASTVLGGRDHIGGDMVASLQIRENLDAMHATPILPSLTAVDFEARSAAPSTAIDRPQSRPPTESSPPPSTATSAGTAKRTIKPSRRTSLPYAVPVPIHATRPVSTSSQPPSSAASSNTPRAPPPPPPIRPPNVPMSEAPMPRFSSAPVMVDAQGREVEWAVPINDDGDGQEDVDVAHLLDQALALRRAMQMEEQRPDEH